VTRSYRKTSKTVDGRHRRTKGTRRAHLQWRKSCLKSQGLLSLKGQGEDLYSEQEIDLENWDDQRSQRGSVHRAKTGEGSSTIKKETSYFRSQVTTIKRRKALATMGSATEKDENIQNLTGRSLLESSGTLEGQKSTDEIEKKEELHKSNGRRYNPEGNREWGFAGSIAGLGG